MESTIINTKGKPLLLKARIYSNSPCFIKIAGIDNNRKNSTYFVRNYGLEERPFQGMREFNFPLPLSPVDLKLIVTSTNSDCDVNILDYKIEKLNQEQVWLKQDEQSFLNFAVQFAVKAGTLSQGTYESDNGDFVIVYTDEIKNRVTGVAENTPARISRGTGIIEINRTKFLSYTIPMRLVILLHEFMHWRLKTRIELKADYNALNIFLKLGFSKTQALSAFTRVFHDLPHLQNRTEKIYEFIEQFPDLNPEQ